MKHQPSDPQAIIKGLCAAVERGESGAQYTLGSCFLGGSGVPKSNVIAMLLFRASAEQGNSDAQYSLGRGYHHGTDVPQDNAEAIKWLYKAAAQGHKNATTLLHEIVQSLQKATD